MRTVTNTTKFMTVDDLRRFLNSEEGMKISQANDSLGAAEGLVQWHDAIILDYFPLNFASYLPSQNLGFGLGLVLGTNARFPEPGATI